VNEGSVARSVALAPTERRRGADLGFGSRQRGRPPHGGESRVLALAANGTRQQRR
jgi:hypothetical protein